MSVECDTSRARARHAVAEREADSLRQNDLQEFTRARAWAMQGGGEGGPHVFAPDLLSDLL